MAKLVHLNGITGEVVTIAGPITFTNGEAEVSDEIAAQLQIADIRVEIEPQKEEPNKDEASKAPVKKAPVKAPAKK